MSDKPAASNTDRQPDFEGLVWTNLWIEEAEDLTIRPVAEAEPDTSDDDGTSSREGVARNLWIEEEEDLTVRSVPPSTLSELADFTGAGPEGDVNSRSGESEGQGEVQTGDRN